jgi:hypothetical protein
LDARVLDDILATDNRIRYAGILGGDLKTAASKTIDDVKLTLEKEHVDHLLVDLAAPIIIGALSRFSDTCGKLICCGVRYD